MIVPWNDPEAVLRATAEHELAAILAEPFPANMGLVAARERLPRPPARARDATGALLVFDEVITGFRVAPGGAQELTGVTPDLTVMGKVIGGGLPAAAYGGPRELMERIAPAGDVYQAGHAVGQPARGRRRAGHAGPARRRRLRLPDGADRERWPRGCARPPATGPCRSSTAPGLLTVFFTAEPVPDYAGAQACDPEAFAAWCRGLLARGVYPPPSQFEAWFPSLAHTPSTSTARSTRPRRRSAEAFSPWRWAAVHAVLLAEGGLLADALGPEPAQDGALGAAAAAGPR